MNSISHKTHEVVSRASAPFDLPITVTEARRALHLYDDTTEDAEIRSLILGARNFVETAARTYLVDTVVRELFRRFPCDRDPIALGVEPIRSITHIKYTTDESTPTLATLANTEYEFIRSHNPPLIALQVGKRWPLTHREKMFAVEVEFVCGPPSGQRPRDGFVNAMKILLSYRHEYPAGVGRGSADLPMPRAIRSLLQAEGLFGYP